MWTIAKSLTSTTGGLFPTVRDRAIVLGLILLAASVSAAELGAAYLFSSLILPSEALTQADLVVRGVLFFVVFGFLRLIIYVQSVYQVDVFETALGRSGHSTGNHESWRWATAMELLAILTQAVRLLVIGAAMVVLAPFFGFMNLVTTAIVAQIFGTTFHRQYQAQAAFREQQRAKQPVSSASKVRSRIKAGSMASLLASACVMVLLALLIAMTVFDHVAAHAALVIFLAIRMEGQLFTGIASSLMRYARARVNSE